MTRTATPLELGYYFPAEFEPHLATWLSWPHKEASWPGKLNTIFPYYSAFVKEISLGEQVCINVKDEEMKQFVDDSVAEFVDSGAWQETYDRWVGQYIPEDQQQGPPDITLQEALELFPLEK